MPFIVPQPVREETAPYVYFEKMFNLEECSEIISLHKTTKKADPFVGKDGLIDEKKRSADLYWIDWSPSLTPLFQRIVDKVCIANQKWWSLGLAGLNEPLQLTHYRAENKGHYSWHEDWEEGKGFSHRKLSGVILLNNQFKGGEFEFLHNGIAKQLVQGSMILFPSFRTHRVVPVTEGERWSLVFWVSGPPFT